MHQDAPLLPNTKPRRFKTLRVIGALIMREMLTTHGRSPGGYLWAVLEPAAGIALLSLLFSLALRSPPLGTNFQIYYATGFLPFILYREIEVKIAMAIRFSKPLLIYPSVVYSDAIFARLILNSITQVLVFFVVLSTIMLIWETRTILDLNALIIGFSMAVFFGFGIGCVNCFIISIFPIWERVWAIVNRPLLFISGIIFAYEDIPEPYRSYLWYNPLIHIVGQVRKAFYATYEASYVSVLYVVGCSLILTVIGFMLLNKFNQRILNS